MLIVDVYVNDTRIVTRTAVRIKGGMQPDDLNTYRLGDGKLIKHRYGDGAEKLVEKMMRYYHKRDRKGD